jgi:hypothetical protein
MAIWSLAREEVDRAEVDVIVLIRSMPRRRALEQRRKVIKQQRFVFVDDNRRRRMQALDVDQARLDGSLGNKRFYLPCQIDELGRVLSGNSDSRVPVGRTGCECLHRDTSMAEASNVEALEVFSDP